MRGRVVLQCIEQPTYSAGCTVVYLYVITPLTLDSVNSFNVAVE